MHDSDFKNKIEYKLKHLEFKQSVNILDEVITLEEIKQSVMVLKNKKTCGPDSGSIEMIKCSLEAMSSILLKIFNHVWHSEIFPVSWAKGYIHPLFINGGSFDPSSCMGITFSFCIGKHFTRIINNRLRVFLLENNIISASKIGFCPGKQTTYHTYICP